MTAYPNPGEHCVESVLRWVPGYGWLPIVRTYDPQTGKPLEELGRGEFRSDLTDAADLVARSIAHAIAEGRLPA